MTRRALLAYAVMAALVVACRSKRATGTASGLRPEDPVDEAFRGCQQSKSCGSRSAPEGFAVTLQPYARVGDYTRCPVSGAVFQISETRQRRDYKGWTLFFCCSACAQYFDEHSDRAAALRRLGGRPIVPPPP